MTGFCSTFFHASSWFTFAFCGSVHSQVEEETAELPIERCKANQARLIRAFMHAEVHAYIHGTSIYYIRHKPHIIKRWVCMSVCMRVIC